MRSRYCRKSTREGVAGGTPPSAAIAGLGWLSAAEGLKSIVVRFGQPREKRTENTVMYKKSKTGWVGSKLQRPIEYILIGISFLQIFIKM